MWFYKDKLFENVLEEFDSFVYLIERINILEDADSPIFYIGKKTFYNKSKYKGKRIIVESNWWDYYGSSEWLNEDIQKYGKENFKRNILHLCRTKGDAGYLEAKEQMDRNVLHVAEDGYKLFYNKNILGRYRNEPEFYLIENDLKVYYNIETIHGNNYNKKWITNGKENKLVNNKIAEELVTNNIWVYGRSEKHIWVNDGTTNFFIPKSQYNEETQEIDLLKKYITNGIKDKLLPIHEIDEYIKHNKEWRVGYTKSSNEMWITNGVEDKRIYKKNLDEYSGYKPGRSEIKVRNKISVFKDDDFKWILETELEKYLSDGWVKRGKSFGNNLFFVTNDLIQKHFRTEIERNDFLKENPSWRIGQFKRINLTTKDVVIAKDIRTDERIIVSCEEYKSNKYLTSVKTKKVKIKRSNRIIFIGYLKLFLIENPKYPKNLFTNAARSESGDIYLKKGKNTWINEEKLNIKYL